MTRTDESGLARFHGVRPGPNELRVQSDDHVPARQTLDVPPQGWEEPVVIALTAGGPGVTGTVRDVDSKPIAGVHISLYSPNPSWDATLHHRSTKSGADGGFRVSGLAPRQWNYSASNTGYAEAKGNFEVPESGDGASIEIVMQEGGVIRGTVLDAEDRPVPGRQILAILSDVPPVRLDEAAREERRKGVGNSSQDGKFRLNLPTGQYRIISGQDLFRIRGAELKRLVSQAVTARTGDSGVVLRVDNMGELRGRVTFSGEPKPAVFHVDAGGNRQTFNADPGEFQMRVEAEEEIETTLSAEGFARTQKKLVVPSGDTLDVDFVLERARNLSGRVLDAESGEPVQGAEVQAVIDFSAQDWTGSRRVHTVISRPDGRFSVAGLGPGPYRVTAKATGYASHNHGIVNVPGGGDAQSVEIRLRAGFRISGRVIDESTGKPIEGAWAYAQPVIEGAWSPEAPIAMPQTGSDGRFTIEGLTAGRYQVIVNAEGYPTRQSDPVELSVGHPAPSVEIRLRVGGRITGQIVADATGEPILDVEVWIWPVQDHSDGLHSSRSTRQATISNGRFYLEGVEDGKHMLTVWAHGFTQKIAGPYTVQLGQTVGPIEIRLTKGYTVSGRMMVDGQPLKAEGASLSAMEPDTPPPWNCMVRSGSTNVFSCDGVVPGKYRVYAWQSSSGPSTPDSFSSGIVDVPVGGFTDLEIEMTRSPQEQ